jgi:hypothetical protein
LVRPRHWKVHQALDPKAAWQLAEALGAAPEGLQYHWAIGAVQPGWRWTIGIRVGRGHKSESSCWGITGRRHSSK